jgi:hypothetical protein
MELGYGVMHSTYHLCAINLLFVFKVQMINSTVQNDFHMNI